MISYLIATRDDSFCGDSFGRLCRTIDNLLDLPVEHELELVITEWGTESLADRLKLDYEGGTITVLSVPQSITETIPSPFSEVHALNLAARHARGEWLGRIDQDTLVGHGFVSFFENQIKPSSRRAYFSTRRELPSKSVWMGWPLEKDDFIRAAVGILLTPKAAWHSLRGYDERLIHRNHMEWDFCLRLAKLVGLENLALLTEPQADFYHQPHELDAIRQHNEMPNLFKIIREIEGGRLVWNDENWGLSKYDNQIKKEII